MDYLSRDSLHCGVDYGRFDRDRLVDTVMIVEDKREESPADLRVGVAEGGMHAAEGLILARYFMFTQVYFHPVRKAYDHHAAECVRLLLETKRTGETRLPDPREKAGRRRFLDLDDWSVLQFVKRRRAGRHGEAILSHRHDRCVHQTPEVPRKKDLDEFADLEGVLQSKGFEVWSGDAEKEWYTLGKTEIQIGRPVNSILLPAPATPLSEASEVVGRIPESKQRLLFVPVDRAEEASQILIQKRRQR
jgi:HD superfamily phosphohydrolase